MSGLAARAAVPAGSAGASPGVSLTAADIAAVPADVVAALRHARCVMTVCHENPEADALGAALAVALVVEELGGRATPVCADPVPALYDFMPGIERFRTAPERDLDYDLVVVVDCGELERVGGVLDAHRPLFERVRVMNIDHHKSNPRFGAVAWVDPAAAATCEQVTLLVGALGLPLTAAGGAIAAALMAGVVMDTATFQHPNATPRTLRAAADLVAAGAPLSATSRLLYRTKPVAQLRLFGRVLARLESDLDGRLVWSILLEADLAATGAFAAHSEGLIDLLGQAERSEVAILLKENGPQTRISVRTRDGGVDATVLAGRFGGGGHARAAGATLDVPVGQAVVPVLEAAHQLIEAMPAR